MWSPKNPVNFGKYLAIHQAPQGLFSAKIKSLALQRNQTQFNFLHNEYAAVIKIMFILWHSTFIRFSHVDMNTQTVCLHSHIFVKSVFDGVFSHAFKSCHQLRCGCREGVFPKTSTYVSWCLEWGARRPAVSHQQILSKVCDENSD